MTISFVPQPPDIACCVQACCAMLTNMTLEAVCKEFGHCHSSRTKEAIQFLRKCGYACPDRLKPLKKDGALPDLCLLRLRFGKRSMGHMVVYHDGVVYDPSLGKGTLSMYDAYEDVRVASHLPLTREVEG